VNELLERKKEKKVSGMIICWTNKGIGEKGGREINV
jgi:hypothetical protein